MEKYIFVICVVLLMFFITVGRFVFSPFKRIVRVLCNSALGFAVIYIINSMGTSYNLHIGLNWWTLVCSGVLGIPGIVLMLLVKLFV